MTVNIVVSDLPPPKPCFREVEKSFKGWEHAPSMEHRRTSLFVALLLLSPITVVIPLISQPFATTTYTTSHETTLTYASAASTQTYYSYTRRNALIPTPIDLPSKVVGFVALKGKCSQYTYPLTVTSGTILNVKLTANQPINVYLLSTYQFQTLPDGCKLAVTPLLFEANFTTYTLHWVATSNEVLYIILTGPTAIVTLTDQGSSQPVQELANVTYATSTQTEFQPIVSISTAIYTATTTTPFLTKATNDHSGYTPIIGVVIVLLGALLLLIKKRRT